MDGHLRKIFLYFALQNTTFWWSYSDVLEGCTLEKDLGLKIIHSRYNLMHFTMKFPSLKTKTSDFSVFSTLPNFFL